MIHILPYPIPFQDHWWWERHYWDWDWDWDYWDWDTWRLGAVLLKLPVQEWMLQRCVLWWCEQMYPSQWRLQPQHLHGRNRHTSCTYTHSSYNWVTWRLGAMLQKLPVQEWMLQWHVFRRCAQMHPTQWRCLQPLHLHGCMSKLGVTLFCGKFLHY